MKSYNKFNNSSVNDLKSSQNITFSPQIFLNTNNICYNYQLPQQSNICMFNQIPSPIYGDNILDNN